MEPTLPPLCMMEHCTEPPTQWVTHRVFGIRWYAVLCTQHATPFTDHTAHRVESPEPVLQTMQSAGPSEPVDIARVACSLARQLDDITQGRLPTTRLESQLPTWEAIVRGTIHREEWTNLLHHLPVETLPHVLGLRDKMPAWIGYYSCVAKKQPKAQPHVGPIKDAIEALLLVSRIALTLRQKDRP